MSAVLRPRAPLRVFLVDDEPLARSRIRELLGDIAEDLPTAVVGEAGNGQEALMLLAGQQADVALIDVQMPEMTGLELARHLQRLDPPPSVVFTTAFPDYAVAAFEIDALDYLLKPIRAARLKNALARAVAAEPVPAPAPDTASGSPRRHLSVAERGRITLVPVLDIVYLRAEQKYVTLRTREREHLIEASLVQLEQEFSGLFVRVHRSCLVARRLIRGFERAADTGGEGAGWTVLLEGIEERVPVSRRLWPSVRQVAAS